MHGAIYNMINKYSNCIAIKTSLLLACRSSPILNLRADGGHHYTSLTLRPADAVLLLLLMLLSLFLVQVRGYTDIPRHVAATTSFSLYLGVVLRLRRQVLIVQVVFDFISLVQVFLFLVDGGGLQLGILFMSLELTSVVAALLVDRIEARMRALGVTYELIEAAHALLRLHDVVVGVGLVARYHHWCRLLHVVFLFLQQLELLLPLRQHLMHILRIIRQRHVIIFVLVALHLVIFILDYLHIRLLLLIVVVVAVVRQTAASHLLRCLILLVLRCHFIFLLLQVVVEVDRFLYNVLLVDFANVP